MRQRIIRCDIAILNCIVRNRKPWITSVMKLITVSGNAGFIWFFVAFILGLYKMYMLTAYMLLSLAFFVLLGNIILKNLFQRKRPFQIYTYETIIKKPSSFSFPSGHAYSSFAAATVLTCAGGFLSIPAILLAFGIAFSRIYFCVHYPSDIICSLVLGIGTGLLSFIIL